MTKLLIKTCPTCGSKQIRRVKRDIPSGRGREPYVARIVVEECPNCGERLYSTEALAQIAAQQPRQKPRRRKSA